jgi:hypothetical protein
MATRNARRRLWRACQYGTDAHRLMQLAPHTTWPGGSRLAALPQLGPMQMVESYANGGPMLVASTPLVVTARVDVLDLNNLSYTQPWTQLHVNNPFAIPGTSYRAIVQVTRDRLLIMVNNYPSGTRTSYDLCFVRKSAFGNVCGARITESIYTVPYSDIRYVGDDYYIHPLDYAQKMVTFDSRSKIMALDDRDNHFRLHELPYSMHTYAPMPRNNLMLSGGTRMWSCFATVDLVTGQQTIHDQCAKTITGIASKTVGVECHRYRIVPASEPTDTVIYATMSNAYPNYNEWGSMRFWMHDTREETPRELSTPLDPRSDYICSHLFSYNGGHSLLLVMGSRTIFHYDVRADRWQNTRLLLPEYARGASPWEVQRSLYLFDRQ